MNILVVTFDFSPFSARFIHYETKAYIKAGAKVKVLTIYDPDINKTQKINNLEVVSSKYFWPAKLQVLRKPNEPIYNQKSLLAIIQIPIVMIILMFQILKHARWVNIIHCQWTITVLLALPAKWLFRKKVVVTARGSDIRLLPKWLNRFIHKRVDAAIDCYGPQKWNIEYQKKFPANYIKLPLIINFKVIDSTTIPEDIKIADKKKFIILFIGRFDSFKIREGGAPLFTLLNAAQIIRKKNKNFHIFYIGDGNKIIKIKMQNLIKQYNLNENVTLLGYKNNIGDYLPFCNLGTGGTAFNNTSQEFSLYQKPQLLVRGYLNTDTPWKDKINALFFETANPKNLADVILFAMQNPKKLKEIGNNAYKMMSQYVTDLEEGGRLYLQAFQKIINQD